MSVAVIEYGVTNVVSTDTIRSIPLTNSSIPCFVDLSDYETVTKYRWYLSNRGYVINTLTGESMHRFLMNCDSDKVVHHVNEIKTDNRRSNLEVISRQEHSRIHKTKKEGIFKDYHGFVLVDNPNKQFRSLIWYLGNRISLGYYHDPISAEIVYNIVLNEIHGE